MIEGKKAHSLNRDMHTFILQYIICLHWLRWFVSCHAFLLWFLRNFSFDIAFIAGTSVFMPFISDISVVIPFIAGCLVIFSTFAGDITFLLAILPMVGAPVGAAAITSGIAVKLLLLVQIYPEF
jgi:hypothetical protein